MCLLCTLAGIGIGYSNFLLQNANSPSAFFEWTSPLPNDIRDNRVDLGIPEVLVELLLGLATLVATVIVGMTIKSLSKQRAMEFHLREEVERLALVARLTTNAIVVTDAHRKITWVNEGFTRLTGYTMQDALGKSPGKLLQFENSDKKTIEAIQTALNAEQPYRGTILNRGKCGREYWLEIDIQPQHNPFGKLTGFIAIESDVTSRKMEQDRLKSTFEAVAEGIVELNSSGEIINGNPAAERILGISLDQMCGRTPMDPSWLAIRIDGSVLPDDEHPVSVTLRTGIPIADFVHGIHTPDGYNRWISVSTSPISDCRGTVLSVIASFGDVSTKVNELHRFESILQGARLGTWDWHVPSGKLTVDNEWARMLGYDLAELEQDISAWERLLKPSELSRVWNAIREHFAGDSESINCEIPLLRKDGTFGWVLFSGKVTERLADGSPKRVLGVHVNIASQKSSELALIRAKSDAEAALRETHATRTALNDHSLLSVTNRKGCIVEANPGFCRVSGYSSEELVGRDHRILNSGVHPKSFWTEVWKTISAGKAWRGEVCNRCKDGTLYWVDSTIVPYFGPDGKIEKYVSIRFDITAQKAAEAGLVAAKLQANSANIAKSEFLANMSHEIRTPMTAILGYTELLAVELRNTSPSSDCAEYVDVIHRNGEHLLQIINDILDLSKIEAGKMTVEQVELNPCHIVREVLSLMDVRAKSKSLKLEAYFDTSIPSVILSDPVRLRQILVNLVGNAIKFTELGGVTIRVGYDSASGMIHFDVIDTGIGMTSDQAAKLFQAFVQADASTTRKFGGTGLGLQISKRLAEMLGGSISLESQFAKGSRFRVSIAASIASGCRMIERDWGRADTEGLTIASTPEFAPRTPVLKLENMRILLAEDGPDNQRLFAHILRKAGAIVTVVENGKQAVECLTADGSFEGELKSPSDYDLFLTDMQMPVMDGYEATKYLRSKGATLPIVALTANVMSSDVAKCNGLRL